MKTTINTTIHVTDLSIGYPSKKETLAIAQGIDFTLQAGELGAIIGSNGIGKSTLLRTIAKIQPALSGTIEIENSPLNAYDASTLAKSVSLVLTEPLTTKNMTVFEIVALGRQPYSNWIGTLSADDNITINEVLQMLSLEKIALKKCYELSDGQLQRVMIARALAQDTKIILLDEPTTHLDLHHKISILKVLRNITHETGKTILFTSHEIELAIRLCDKMVLMNKDMTHCGTPDDLVNSGAFNSLFPANTVTFDTKTRTFLVNP